MVRRPLVITSKMSPSANSTTRSSVKLEGCQIGTQRQAEILRRVARGQAGPSDAATLIELGRVMTDASICGLGQAAALAIISAHGRWPELFAAPPAPNGRPTVIRLHDAH